MDNKVVGLDGNVFTPAPVETHESTTPVEGLVTLLQHLLKDAESGEIRSLIGVGLTADGRPFTVSMDEAMDGPQRYILIGALTIMKTAYTEAVLMGIESIPRDAPELEGDAT